VQRARIQPEVFDSLVLHRTARSSQSPNVSPGRPSNWISSSTTKTLALSLSLSCVLSSPPVSISPHQDLLRHPLIAWPPPSPPLRRLLHHLPTELQAEPNPCPCTRRPIQPAANCTLDFTGPRVVPCRCCFFQENLLVKTSTLYTITFSSIRPSSAADLACHS
jgi:hypothetical protein